MAGEDTAAWREHRAEAARVHAEALARRRAAESDRARELLAGFVAAARDLGLTARPLEARAYSGSATYRTQVVGWYLRRNRTLAVGTDGEFYVMTAPRSLRSRLRGAAVPPSEPPLVVGVGARDGESFPLEELLRLRLEAGDDFP